MLGSADRTSRSGAKRLRPFLAATLLLGSGWIARAQPAPVATLEGRLLVARRGLADARFRGTVILVIRHDASGAFGLIVNRPTDVDLMDILPDAAGLGTPGAHVFAGGPVLPRVGLALFRSEATPRGAMHVTDDLFMTMSRDTLDAMRAGTLPYGEFRLYLGHSGWAAGQLDQELARGDWTVAPVDLDAIFGPDAGRLWQRLRPGGRDGRERRPTAPPGATWTRLAPRSSRA